MSCKSHQDLKRRRSMDRLTMVLVAFIDNAALKLSCKSHGSDEDMNIVDPEVEASIDTNLEIAR